MNKITCLVVDDEPLARSQLVSLIQQESRLELIGQADRKNTAVELINSLKPELVFLDIRMPGGGGFEIQEQLTYRPRIIFVTAHDEYAVQAFEINALDYLLKPVSSNRLSASIDRIASQSGASLGALDLDRWMIPLGSTGKYIALDELLCVRSEDHYTVAIVEGGIEHQVRQTLREWLEQLPESIFYKVERSMVLNTKKIVAAHLSSSGGEVIMGRSNVSVELGTRAAQRIRDLIDARKL